MLTALKETYQCEDSESFHQFTFGVFKPMGFINDSDSPLDLAQLFTVRDNGLISGDEGVEFVNVWYPESILIFVIHLILLNHGSARGAAQKI